jgi:hypothetical protein
MKYHRRPEAVTAVFWDGDKAPIRAFLGREPQMYAHTGEESSALYLANTVDGRCACWLGQWIVRYADGGMEIMGTQEFREQFEAGEPC